jgi:hypothetical protein
MVLNNIKEPLKTGLQTLLLHRQYGAVQPFIYQPFFSQKYMTCFSRFSIARSKEKIPKIITRYLYFGFNFVAMNLQG